ncbi:MAG: hypothetical protein ACOX9E_10330 [Lentisphaeria bacterium]
MDSMDTMDNAASLPWGALAREKKQDQWRRIRQIRQIRPREKTPAGICGQEGQTHKRSLHQAAHPENNLRQSA